MDSILTPFHPDLVAEANHRVANSLTLLGGIGPHAGQGGRQGRQAFQQRRNPHDVRRHRRAHRHGRPAASHAGAYARATARSCSNAHLRDLGATLIAAFSSEQQPVHIEHHGAECMVLTRHVQPLTLILCEILTNAMKYAHPPACRCASSLRCEALSDGTAAW